MTAEQVQMLSRVATEIGLDYSTTADGKGAKFLNFDGDAALEALVTKARSIAEAVGLTNTTVFYVRSALNEAETYFERSDGRDLRQTWRGDSGTGPSDLFRRAVDHILVPYAKAVGAEGYRFSADRFGDKFGLTQPEVEYIRSALRPKSGKALSTVPVLTGA